MTDEEFMRLALEAARESKAEDDRAHPLVGAVVVRDGEVLAVAHRGEDASHPGAHAEYYALEHKLPHVPLAGATVYTTLEPCTSRNHPKLPCAERLITRRVGRVVIGMLDPNQSITGKGLTRLREAGIKIDLFSSELMAQAEEMNRAFAQAQRGRHAIGEIFHGSQNVRDAVRRTCLEATESIRFLVHALGATHKFDDDLARNLAERIRDREVTEPIRFRPVIVVDRAIPIDALARAVEQREQLYRSYDVGEHTRPTFVRSDEPLGLDVLIADRHRLMLMVTTASGSPQVHSAIVLDHPSRLIDRFVTWFDEVVRARGLSLDELRASFGNRPS
jgi:pyrimidine deaminase RibD-like protein